jgi:exodeoxyribonuclease V gamma subunit
MIRVRYSQSLECLAHALAERMQTERLACPQDILQPYTIVVSHPNLARWLSRFFSENLGISANVDFLLLSEWLDALAPRSDPSLRHQEARDTFLETSLQLWTLLWEQQMQRESEGSDTEKSEALNCWYRARRFAKNFIELQIYRAEWFVDGAKLPDLPAHSESGMELAVLHEWLRRFGVPERAGRMHQALLRLRDGSQRNTAAELKSSFTPSLFGFNHLPPDTLQLLSAYTQDLDLYFYTPCEEYWADTVQQRFLEYRKLESLADQFPHHFEVGHPLLSELGTHGQKHFIALSDLSEHWEDLAPHNFAPLAPVSDLHVLQAGLRKLDPHYVGGEFAAEKRSAVDDQSIQIVQASSRLSELYALKDMLVRAMAADASLHFEDIAIVSPRIDLYRPFFASVFAEVGSSGTSMPFCASQN